MNFLEALQTKDAITENGMVTHSTTMNDCVNLFFTIGAMRGEDKMRLINLFSKAYHEDPLTAMRILFWVRDIRGGAGERKIFRDLIEFLAQTYPDILGKNIHLIAEYGRWDDLQILFGTELESKALDLIVEGLEKGDGLCAKWVPRKGIVFNKLRKRLKITPKKLRAVLVGKSNTVEQKMCSKSWSQIEFDKIPSLAMSRYTNAFKRNDQDRYKNYLESLKAGTKKVNTAALYPYDVVKNLRFGQWEMANQQWISLPNFMENCEDRILPLVDVSGSMDKSVSNNGNLTCMDVAISLGLYISERNTGDFKDHFITFSAKPSLQKLVGSLRERYTQLSEAHWGMNTNLEAVFELILNKAKENNVPTNQMPTKILILSDMEFDEAKGGNQTSQEMIKQSFETFGYKMPEIIYWNISSRNNNFPVKFDEEGSALISGFSPSILKSILSGDRMSPVKIMEETLNKDRYRSITL